MHGQIDINGKVTQPQWNGIITFDTTSFALSQFGAPYKINNQSITLQYPNINFNNFLVQDSLNNPLKIDGRITSLNNTEFRLGLNANAKDFIIIDAPTSTASGSFSYLRIAIDPANSVVESDETNNNHYLSLGMDSSQNYEYPIVFDFEEDYINGWTWYHDSIGYFHGQRFRHKSLISDPVINDESGEWFLDSFCIFLCVQSCSSFKCY